MDDTGRVRIALALPCGAADQRRPVAPEPLCPLAVLHFFFIPMWSSREYIFGVRQWRDKPPTELPAEQPIAPGVSRDGRRLWFTGDGDYAAVSV